MASIVATTDPTTGSVLIQLDRRLVVDDFNRVVAPGGWGSASTIGGAYTVFGGGANFQVTGTLGQMSTASTGTAYRAIISSAITDVDATVRQSVLVNPTGAAVDTGIMLRYVDPGEMYYMARVRLSPGGVAATLSIQHVVGATRTALTDEFPIPDFLVSASNDYHIRFAISGDTMMARAWVNGSAEPQTWYVTARNTQFTSGAVGLHSWRNAGNTNGAVIASFENFSAMASVEPLDLWRHTPDGTEVLVRGSAFFTEDPAGLGVFWDNEAPFDVDIFYTLRSSDSLTNTITSNTVNLDSGDDVWLRDPYNPSNNLIIEIDDEMFDYCTDDPKIMFSDLLGRVYASTSGIFEIIDTQRPETIAQTRKRYGSTLVLSSKEPEDVTAIEAIIAGGYPLLLSLPVVYQFGLPYGTDWVTIFDVDQQPVGVDRRVPARVWTMPFRLALAPADVDTGNTGGNGIGAGGASYDDLAASAIGLTYTILAATGSTYDQIAAGTGY